MKMGDLDLSLDDIIKKKLIKTGIKRGRNNVTTNRKPVGGAKTLGNKNSTTFSMDNKTFVKARPGVLKNTRGQPQKVSIGDARMKIIQKQRQKITDAREKLGQIAKQTDARLRLLKLRERQRLIPGNRVQTRALPEEQILQRTVRGASAYDDPLMDYNDSVAYMARSFSERAVIDPDLYPYRGRQDPPILYRTVENDLLPSRLYGQEYSWSNPRSTSPIDLDPDIPVKRISSRTPHVTSFRNDDRRDNSPNWDYDEPPIVITKKIKPVETVGILKRSQPSVNLLDRELVRITKESSPLGSKPKGPIRTLNERFCQEGNPSAQKISQLEARLKASQLKNNGNNVESQMGHRIVVSNLVPSVTHEDVKELFEDVGELISSKVVRPGTAEVIYKNHKDAVKAVDVYHNRQLDGQPMKCLLVNNRSKILKPGKPIELDMIAFKKALHKKSTS